MLKKIKDGINIFAHCRALNVGLWSCPSFIFLVMGIVIITSVLATYYIAQRYTEPEYLIGIVTLLTVFLLVITQVLVSAFERVVYSRQRESQQSKELLELKDQFVYIAVHDLSAAATAIKWGLRTIEPKITSFSPAESETFASIRSRNERLIELVRQILLITRIESGHLTIEPKASDVKEVLDQCITEQRRSAEEKGVRITTEYPQTEVSLNTDSDHLGEILRILLTNAIYHTDTKDGKVSVKLLNTEKTTEITIENDGPEIEAETRAHIFEKLWRDKEGKHIEGTGFGLYTVKQLAHMLRGDVRFSSAEGKTEFVLSLPNIWK